MKVVVSHHAWQRYEERMRAHVPADQLHAFCEAALEKGAVVPIKSNEPDIICRMYRRFALVFRQLEGDNAALITILPRGERPRSAKHLRLPEA